MSFFKCQVVDQSSRSIANHRACTAGGIVLAGSVVVRCQVGDIKASIVFFQHDLSPWLYDNS